MAQQQPRLAHPAPLVDLEREAGVGGFSFAYRQLPVAAEADGARVHPVGLQAKARVPAFAHRLYVARHRSSDQQRRRGVGAPEWSQLGQLFGQLHTEVEPADDRVDALVRHPVLRAEHGGRVPVERGGEGRQLLAVEIHAGGGAVPAVAAQVPGAGREPG